MLSPECEAGSWRCFCPCQLAMDSASFFSPCGRVRGGKRPLSGLHRSLERMKARKGPVAAVSGTRDMLRMKQ